MKYITCNDFVFCPIDSPTSPLLELVKPRSSWIWKMVYPSTEMIALMKNMLTFNKICWFGLVFGLVWRPTWIAKGVFWTNVETPGLGIPEILVWREAFGYFSLNIFIFKFIYVTKYTIQFRVSQLRDTKVASLLFFSQTVLCFGATDAPCLCKYAIFGPPAQFVACVICTSMWQNQLWAMCLLLV